MDAVLAEQRIEPGALDAVAVSCGPGSYTGLRIGTSAAKGLAYSLNIPLISIDTLKLLCAAAMDGKASTQYLCPMIDARRMEVYTGIFTNKLEQTSPTEALIVDVESVEKFSNYNNIAFFGDGMNKCRELLSTLSNASFIDGVSPSAKFMSSLSNEKFLQKQFEDTAYFEPFYLKDFLIKSKA